MEKRIRRCSFCANNCPLTEPKCAKGTQMAEEGGIYEEEKKKPSALKQWLELHFGKNMYKF